MEAADFESEFGSSRVATVSPYGEGGSDAGRLTVAWSAGEAAVERAGAMSRSILTPSRDAAHERGAAAVAGVDDGAGRRGIRAKFTRRWQTRAPTGRRARSVTRPGQDPGGPGWAAALANL